MIDNILNRSGVLRQSVMQKSVFLKYCCHLINSTIISLLKQCNLSSFFEIRCIMQLLLSFILQAFESTVGVISVYGFQAKVGSSFGFGSYLNLSRPLVHLLISNMAVLDPEIQVCTGSYRGNFHF